MTDKQLEKIKKLGLNPLDFEPNDTNEVKALKEELATYDYIGVKIATGVATREQYADKIAYCESLREKIRELEN